MIPAMIIRNQRENWLAYNIAPARNAYITLGNHMNNFRGISYPENIIGTNITVGTPTQSMTDAINPAELKLIPFSRR